MRGKVYWGLGVLSVLLIGAFVFVMVNQYAEIKQLEADAKKAQDKANQMKDTPPVAREGHKMVPHGDHWHEVPIDAPDTWQEQTPALIRQAVVTEIDWDSLSDAEKAEWDREDNQTYIDAIADLKGFEEVYQLMTENEFPYSPDVQEKLRVAQWRVTERGALQDARDKERRAKLSEYFEKYLPEFRLNIEGDASHVE